MEIMLSKQDCSERNQYTFVTIDDCVPKDNLLRKIDKVIDFNFIYDLVKNLYSVDEGRPSIDPVVLIKIPLIQTLFGIPSMRRTVKDINVNLAYRWFLGFGFDHEVPHFSTFGKNFERRFKGTTVFEDIFTEILMQCQTAGLVDSSVIFVDGTHVKAHANNKKYKKEEMLEEAAFYKEELDKEITKDRERHSKKALKKKNINEEFTSKKISKTDPESGWFHKGEHKQVFAYNIQTACDIHGWILSYSVHSGNKHDSKAFNELYPKLKKEKPVAIVADSGYKTPAIAHMLVKDKILPVFPYTRPKTQKGFFKKHEFVYDEFFDCYICPAEKILKYSTTNREGYREYKSNKTDCENCPLLYKCTNSKMHQKLIQRHVWQENLDYAEDLRYHPEIKKLYNFRKETIERDFGTAKEFHNFRYTNLNGKEKMDMKAALTFACLNMKKLANLRA